MRVPKKDDNSDINNYTGITLTSIFSKIVSIMLEKSLRDSTEINNVKQRVIVYLY